MCGIAGFAGLPYSAEEAGARLRAMCDAIRHRGPDSDGFLVADGIALGMRRLAIIDVAGGRQPISNEDGTVTVVFNGEIYNHRVLRGELKAAGHTFSTRSDTEVLVHLYEEHGPDFVKRLHGMFGFAIWDAGRRLLVIGRDRSGMKPLSYMEVPGGLIFGSELRSLWVLRSRDMSISPAAVMAYMAFGYVPDPRSIFEGVRKLPPGHLLLWSEREGATVREYWAPPDPVSTQISEGELIATLREKLDHAVASHLESEVPLGAFLSGGLDSSTVVALMTRHAAGRVKTFSIGFREAAYDESGAARAVAQQLGTEHTELIVDPDVENIFEDIASMFDEPFADSSAIANFLVAQLARAQVTVALSGDGGDELFGGYSRYQEILRRAGRTGLLPRALVAHLGMLLPHAAPGRNRLIDLGRSRWGQYACTVVQPIRVDEGGVGSAAQPGGLVAIEDQLAEWIQPGAGGDFAAAMMRVDFRTYLPGAILTKVDRTSMAVSLEARAPLLDADLVDFALSIPGHLSVTAGGGKTLFRKAIRGIVPDFVLSRPKQGFAVPLAAWFRGPLRPRIEALRGPSSELRDYVDQGAVDRVVREHLVARRDHSAILWRLIVLENWMKGLQQGRLGQPPVAPRMRDHLPLAV